MLDSRVCSQGCCCCLSTSEPSAAELVRPFNEATCSHILYSSIQTHYKRHVWTLYTYMSLFVWYLSFYRPKLKPKMYPTTPKPLPDQVIYCIHPRWVRLFWQDMKYIFLCIDYKTSLVWLMWLIQASMTLFPYCEGHIKLYRAAGSDRQLSRTFSDIARRQGPIDSFWQIYQTWLCGHQAALDLWWP